MKSIVAAALFALGAGGVLLPASADAAPLGRQAFAPTQHVATDLVQVQHPGYGGPGPGYGHGRPGPGYGRPGPGPRYDYHRHGQRYSYRRPGYTHFYGGYWYASPWWLGAAIIPPVVPYMPPRHHPRRSMAVADTWIIA